MVKGVPLTSDNISSLHTATHLHDVATIRGRLSSDGREAELEPGYIMGSGFNNISLGIGLDSILEVIRDV